MILILFVSGGAFAGLLDHSKCGAQCGEGTIPYPLCTNEKVELADGEYYTLVGWIKNVDTDAPYFQVDLKSHPWLENSKRFKLPHYPLLDLFPEEAWIKYESVKVQIIVKAQGRIEYDFFEIPRYVLSLKPIAKPIRLISR